MSPLDIQKLSENSSVKSVLEEHKGTWTFLRNKVQWNGQSGDRCGRCGQHADRLLGSPYNAIQPGWCIECVLTGFVYEMPEWNPNLPRLDGYVPGSGYSSYCFVPGGDDK